MIARPMATVRLFADGLRPEAIAGLIDAAPEAWAAKGEAFSGVAGRAVVARTGTWFLTSRGRELGDDPGRHLEWVVGKVSGAMKGVREVVPDVGVEVSLLVHDKGFRPGDLGAEVLLNAVILGELVVEVPEAGREWRITREDVVGYLGRS